jgi:SHS2 domain-containing protein
VEWLNELLYQREIHSALFCWARVSRLEQAECEWILEGTACGETLDPQRHTIHTEVKAATYSGLDYRQEQDLCIVQCVVDL